MQTKKTQKTGQVLIYALQIVMIIFAAIGTSVVIPPAQTISDGVVNILYLCIVDLVVIIIHIIIHEAGHMIFGLLTGYRFNSFRIFNIMLQLDDDGKLRFYKHGIAGTGGQCLMEPPDVEPARLPYFWYNLGGIIANALVAAIFSPLCLLTQAGGYIVAVFASFTAFGLFFAVTNGVPVPGSTNDGRNLLELYRSDTAKLSVFIQLKSQILLKKGIGITEFPDEWFIMPDDDELSNTMSTVLAVNCCERLMSEGKFREAHEAIDALLGKDAALYSIHEEELKANALFCELIGNMDSARISGYYDKSLQKTMKAMSGYPKFIRTEYAYHLLFSKDEKKASKLLYDFEDAAKTFPFPSEIKIERQMIGTAQQAALKQASIYPNQ